MSPCTWPGVRRISTESRFREFAPPRFSVVRERKKPPTAKRDRGLRGASFDSDGFGVPLACALRGARRLAGQFLAVLLLGEALHAVADGLINGEQFLAVLGKLTAVRAIAV